MPAHSASEDARRRAYVAGIHVFAARPKKDGLLGVGAVILAREPADDLAQPRLVDLFRRLRGGEPFDDPLLFFRPLFALAPHFERKHMHVAEDDGAALEPLFIGEGADGALGNRAAHPGLFEGLARGRRLRRFALLRPALRDHPAAVFPSRDEHELRPAGAVPQPVGQGAVLAPLRGSGFTRVTHRLRRGATRPLVTQTSRQNYSRQRRQERALWSAQEALPNSVTVRRVAKRTQALLARRAPSARAPIGTGSHGA